MRKIAVFCGARFGVRERYVELARELGALFAREGCGLVYGGGRVGLMGVVAQACLDHGGHVTGVIPHFLNTRELLHPGLQSLYTTSDLFERKSRIMAIADAFVALPGGIGTFDELLEVMAWRQLRQMDKPIALLDVDGYFQPWLAALEHSVTEGFLDPIELDRLIIHAQPARMLEALLGACAVQDRAAHGSV
ncbi:MAG TPA: TIGR00730 family Rossman fold protein [Gammaproteobacteria bacterium]|nr:TIGR00730 family Rossman fold protein [Gammaproteobacteria bacterium]